MAQYVAHLCGAGHPARPSGLPCPDSSGHSYLAAATSYYGSRHPPVAFFVFPAIQFSSQLLYLVVCPGPLCQNTNDYKPESASGCPQSSENAVFWTFAVRRATSSRRRRNHRSDHPTSCAEAKYLVSRREIDGTLPLERQGSVFGNHSTGKNQTELVLSCHETSAVVQFRLR